MHLKLLECVHLLVYMGDETHTSLITSLMRFRAITRNKWDLLTRRYFLRQKDMDELPQERNCPDHMRRICPLSFFNNAKQYSKILSYDE